MASVDGVLTTHDTIALGSPLRPTDLHRAAGPVSVEVGDEVRARVTRGREFLRDLLAEEDRQVHGATTVFGAPVGFADRDEEADQCDNALAHLGTAQRPDVPVEVSRAALLVRLSSLAQGLSGVSPHVIDELVAMFATTFTPAIPRHGSDGAPGDLIPLAYATQALRGRGQAYVDGRRTDAAHALRLAGLTPLHLDGRDALALVNGTSVTTAATSLALDAVRAAHRALRALTCLLADLLGCDTGFLDADLLQAYGHAGAVDVAGRMRELLAGTIPSGTRTLQEPHCIRCAPQLLGAAEDALRYLDSVVAADLGGVSDNPLFFPGSAKVVHGGNFFGQPAAFAADVLTMVTAQLGNLAEHQLDLLVDPASNGGLPPMLATEPGRQHGLQGVQLAMNAFVAELRRATVPASTQSMPTKPHHQDVVPFGTHAALRAYDMADLLRLLCGLLAVGLRQAVHVGARRPTALGCAALLDALAGVVQPVDPDRPLDLDVRAAADLLTATRLPDCATPAGGTPAVEW
jgi:histidine ammonia-lyase/tyrosine ammonia-lyase